MNYADRLAAVSRSGPIEDDFEYRRYRHTACVSRNFYLLLHFAVEILRCDL
jgi:hypothetical protein